MKTDYKALNDQGLRNKKSELKEELRQIRFNITIAGSVPNPKRIREAKKDIARIETLLTQRAIAAKAK